MAAARSLHRFLPFFRLLIKTGFLNGTGIAAVPMGGQDSAGARFRYVSNAGGSWSMLRFTPLRVLQFYYTPQPLLLDFGLRPVSCALRVHTVICSAKAGEAGVCVSRPPVR